MLPRRHYDLWWVALPASLYLTVLLSASVLAQVTDDWVVEVSDEMSPQDIDNLARRHGFVNIGPVSAPIKKIPDV
jgi:hypothetical protein